MNPISLIAAACIAVAAAAAVILLGCLVRELCIDGRPHCIDSVAARVRPFVLVITLAVTVTQALYRPYSLWDDPRLAMTMAMSRGYPLYAPPGEGPQLTTIYGPIGPVMYLPAVLASRPDVAMIIAGFLAQFYFFAPVAWVCLRGRSPLADGASPPGMPWLLGCLAILLCTSSPSLAYSAFQIHVDAPALGFAGLACLVAGQSWSHSRSRLQTAGWMLAIAVLAALAVFTKQTLLPLLPALVVAVGVRHGLATAGVLSAVLIVVVVSTLVLLGSIFGFEEMAFHALLVPVAHPRDKSLLGVWPWAAGACLPLLALPLTLAWCRTALGAGGKDARSAPGPARELALSPCLLTACLCVPTAVLAFAKRGGAVNNWSLINSFVLLAFLGMAQALLRDRREAVRSVSKAVVLAATVVLSLQAALSDLPKRGMVMRRPSPTARVFEYCRLHPGTAYFPWHPAAVLAAEGKLNHFYYALYDRALAGRPIAPEHFAAHTPDAKALMCFDRDGVFDERFFAEFVAAYEPCDEARLPSACPIDALIFRPKGDTFR